MLKKSRAAALIVVQTLLLLWTMAASQGISVYDNAQLLEDAARGDREACYTLAHLLLHGRGGMERDLPAAVSLLEKAAGAGHRDAAFDLAMLYLKGDMRAKDPEKTIYWLQQAARMGNAAACSALEQVYRRIDAEKAAYWLQQCGAADR